MTMEMVNVLVRDIRAGDEDALRCLTESLAQIEFPDDIEATIKSILDEQPMVFQETRRRIKRFLRTGNPNHQSGEMTMKTATNDLVAYAGKTYHLADLAHYMEDEHREVIHSADHDGTEQGFWAKFVERYPAEAQHLAEITPAATWKMDYIAVQVDGENNAEVWWDALREQYPRFAETLQRDGAAVIHESLWNTLAALPGFSDGPEHASTALIDCGGEGASFTDCGAKWTFDSVEDMGEQP